MDCVKIRSDVFLEMSRDKKALRRINVLYLAVTERENDRIWERLRSLRDGLIYADKKFDNMYGRDGLWHRGLENGPMRCNSTSLSSETVTTRELLEGGKVSFEDVLSSNIPLCSYCRDRCPGCSGHELHKQKEEQGHL